MEITSLASSCAARHRTRTFSRSALRSGDARALDLYFGGQPPCLTGLRARWEGDTTPPPTFTCRELRECDSVAVRVPQHGVRLNRISHITLAYVFTQLCLASAFCYGIVSSVEPTVRFAPVRRHSVLMVTLITPPPACSNRMASLESRRSRLLVNQRSLKIRMG